MRYNVEGRLPFGVRWQPALPKPGEGGSAAATPLWAERSDGAFSNGRRLSCGAGPNEFNRGSHGL